MLQDFSVSGVGRVWEDRRVVGSTRTTTKGLVAVLWAIPAGTVNTSLTGNTDSQVAKQSSTDVDPSGDEVPAEHLEHPWKPANSLKVPAWHGTQVAPSVLVHPSIHTQSPRVGLAERRVVIWAGQEVQLPSSAP